MSTVSTVFDAMVTRIGTVLSSHSRLPNPYFIERNPETMLKQGWGLGFGPAQNTEKILCNKLTVERQFQVVICRRIYALDSDAASRATADKDINEDLILVIKDFESDNTINGTTMWCKYISDEGVSFLESEQDNYVVIKATFATEYIESLT